MENLTKLSPSEVWKFFEEICQVPRPSKKEVKIRQYLLDFAKKNQLQTKSDNIGNVVISKPATPGYEELKTLVLQTHMDMVCEKNADVVHNFDTDPIKPAIHDGWVKASGTTLGADNGIGIAIQLAILASDKIEHGALECLITVDEETGLTGAFEMAPDLFTGKILINLDSEEEGEITVGSAGGMDTLVKLKAKKCWMINRNNIAYKVSLSGLKGGHSGEDINKGRGNAVKIMNRFLWNCQQRFDIRLASFDGGNLRNAIAREANAIIVLKASKEGALRNYLQEYEIDIKHEFSHTEPDIEFSLGTTQLPWRILSRKFQKKLLNAIYACPHGVTRMSQSIPGLVETSTNLASIKFDQSQIVITTSQRSSINSAKVAIANKVWACFKLAGASIEHSHGYPGWSPNLDSKILKVSELVYERLYNKKPKVKAIHAGLECGLFTEKYHGLDIISVGPTIESPHSPDERVDIESVERFWKYLLEVIKNVPKSGV
jgi:dipeptidase D